MAYISPATIASVEPEAGRIVLRYTGDAGEPPVLEQYYLSDTTTQADVRRHVYAAIRRLNSKRTTIAAIPVGQTVPELAPATVTPTAKQVWLEKVSRYRQFAGLGLTGAGATALTALLADINATYAAGYLDA